MKEPVELTDLSEAQLREIKAGIASVALAGDTWYDDHILCCSARIITKAGTTYVVALWWVGWQGVAAIKYANACRDAMNEAEAAIGEAARAALDGP